MNLRNECDVLEMCINIAGNNLAPSIKEDFANLKKKVNDEIIGYHRLRS